jgi:TPR repeat protein
VAGSRKDTSDARRLAKYVEPFPSGVVEASSMGARPKVWQFWWSFVLGCSTPTAQPPPVSSTETPARAATPLSSSEPSKPRIAHVAGQKIIRAPIISDPDPLSLSPLPAALDPQVVCATPFVPARSIPKLASKRVHRLADLCARASKKSPESALVCSDLADALIDGMGTWKNAVLADHAYARACALGSTYACSGLGVARVTGVGAPLDPECGESVLEWVCDHGNVDACSTLGTFLVRGEFVPYEPRRGHKLLSDACERGSFHACLWLAGEAAKESSVEAALRTRGRENAIASCEAGDRDACTEISAAFDPRAGKGRWAWFGISEPDPTRAAHFADLACKRGSGFRCWSPELSAMRDDIWGDVPLAQTCEEGVASDCRKRADQAAGFGHIALALELRERACPSVTESEYDQDVDAESCEAAGRAYLSGSGVAADPERAAELFATGCRVRWGRGARGACAALAAMFDSGTGAVRDEERATSLYAAACSSAETGACETLKVRLGNPLEMR